jgi:2-aminoadipate transaminase
VVAEPMPQDVPDVPHDLSRLAPDEKEFPAAAFAELLAETARNGALLAYGSPFGYRPLRETIADRLKQRGIPADPDSLLVVNGAQQGLDLITRALVDPGDPVAVEEPSYAGALSLFRAHRARLLGVPLDEDGPALEPLQRALRENPKFFYTMPDFHNPTGLLAAPSRRSQVASSAVAAGILVVEDAFDADLSVEGELPPPLAALAPSHVVHIGTLSKALFPGIRIGWVSGPREFIHRLAALKRVGELTSPPVLQAAVNHFIVRGDYDRHLARIRAKLKSRLALAHRTVLERFPLGTRCARSTGGYVLFAELPEGLSGRALAAAARERGVLVSPGAEFRSDRADVAALRLSVARGTGPEIQKALEIVGTLARAMVRRSRQNATAGAKGREESLIQV